MDEKYMEEGSLPNKLPISLNCKSNSILKEKGKLKIYPPLTKLIIPPEIDNQSFEPLLYLVNTPRQRIEKNEENKNIYKKEENATKSAEKKIKTKLELFEEEKEDLLREFENSIKEIKEEEAIKIFKEATDFKEKYDFALKIKKELEKTIQADFSDLISIEKGKYLKKSDGNPKKMTLVLELQGVIQFITGISYKEFDLCIPIFRNNLFLFNVYIKNRKYIGEFLLTMAKHFELIAFSEMFDDTLIAMTNFLEEAFDFKFDYVIGSSHAFSKNNSSMTIKNMNCLLENRQRENLVILDYNMDNCCFYLDRTILVPRFKGKEEDENFLKYLAKYLIIISRKGKQLIL